MAPSTANVVVAGTGTVYVAPAATALPTTLATPAVAFKDIGYTSEAGAKFTFTREQDFVNAWQSADPVRVLLTKEPKVIALELLEFGNPEALNLALRGGTRTLATGVITYTPPAAGGSDQRAMVIDGKDGIYTFRFCFAAVELSGNIEFSLVKASAVSIPLEFNVLAGGWTMITDHPGWVAAGAGLGPVEGLASLTRAELNEHARTLGVENPEGLDNKEAVLEKIVGITDLEPVGA